MFCRGLAGQPDPDETKQFQQSQIVQSRWRDWNSLIADQLQENIKVPQNRAGGAVFKVLRFEQADLAGSQ